MILGQDRDRVAYLIEDNEALADERDNAVQAWRAAQAAKALLQAQHDELAATVAAYKDICLGLTDHLSDARGRLYRLSAAEGDAHLAACIAHEVGDLPPAPPT